MANYIHFFLGSKVDKDLNKLKKLLFLKGISLLIGRDEKYIGEIVYAEVKTKQKLLDFIQIYEMVFKLKIEIDERNKHHLL